MSRTAAIVAHRIRQLVGMKKRADGIALGDDRLRSEGDRTLAHERAWESPARPEGRSRS
ncbi:hypothetical protein OHT61_31215 [Streptomyces sp. NBC_00178]|uniref:hypothetical protein n=1 Tax=Streptomyces sp. NBC_00178 TaxID=2975672 RepID=UPI002E2DD024|nr:hypothetical protein [Streptomyces sp. NBC_00178]